MGRVERGERHDSAKICKIVERVMASAINQRHDRGTMGKVERAMESATKNITDGKYII